MSDARFEGAPSQTRLNLKAFDKEDLQVISALCQDAVIPVSEMAYYAVDKQFACLINRFRWEADVKTPERVQSVLLFNCVDKVITSGIESGDKNQVLSLMSIALHAGQKPSGQILLTFAGHGEVSLSVECPEIILRDVTRPYRAPSRQMPKHKLF